MKTLMIKDLTASTELDGKAIAAVAGGTSYFPHLPLVFVSRQRACDGHLDMLEIRRQA